MPKKPPSREAMVFLAARLVERTPPLPPELRGLHLEAAVFATPEMTIYMDLRLEEIATDGYAK